MHAFLLLLLPALSCALTSVSGAYDCGAHKPAFVFPPDTAADADCLSLLRSSDAALRARFDVCKDTTCYLFLQEAPFIVLPPDMLAAPSAALLDRYQKPVPCGRPHNIHRSLGGIAFDLHALTDSRDAYCVWAGPIEQCSFDALVDFTHAMSVVSAPDRPYRFAISGLLLETPQRRCNHNPSAPFVDNSMVIIGRNTGENPAAKGPFYQLVRPFRPATWGIFGAVVMSFMLVCFAIAVRFHVLRGRSLVTAFFIFAGERDQAMAYEHAGNPTANGLKQSFAFATKYGLSMTLFRISMLAFVAVFALFYEVAVVNFLFQQQTLQLDKSVRSLSISELHHYSVLKNSALESVWETTVNPKGLKYDSNDSAQIPWQRCDDAAQCIKWVADEEHSVNFDVTFEILGNYLIGLESNCQDLTVFHTRDILYQFNAGWLYNKAVNATWRDMVDRQLVGLRVNGKIRAIVEEAVGDLRCEAANETDIGPLIILVPLGLFVLPPLLASMAVIACWRTRNDGGRDLETGEVLVARDAPDLDLALGPAASKGSLLDSGSEDAHLAAAGGPLRPARIAEDA